MLSVQNLLMLVTLGITIWCYWRILGKSGINSWWAFLLLLSLAGTIFASILRSPYLLLLPYIVPAIMIWVFAFMSWPSFETESTDDKNRNTKYLKNRDKRKEKFN